MKLFQEENKNEVLNCEGEWRVELKITNICYLRFILDNKLATMYSSVSPEGGSDSSENRGEFLNKPLIFTILGLSWITSWQLCTAVEVLKVDQIVQRIEESFWRNYSEQGLVSSHLHQLLSFSRYILFKW